MNIASANLRSLTVKSFYSANAFEPSIAIVFQHLEHLSVNLPNEYIEHYRPKCPKGYQNEDILTALKLNPAIQSLSLQLLQLLFDSEIVQCN